MREIEDFNQKFKEKVEGIAESYADLAAARIQTALTEKRFGSAEMSEIQENVRVLAHITTTLERINRMKPYEK